MSWAKETERLKRQVQELPISRVLGVPRQHAVSVQVPSLVGLHVRVPRLPDINEGDLWAKFVTELGARAPRRERSAEEGLQLGDEVLLDVVGRVKGQLIPHTARHGLWLDLAPEPMLPNFFESLIGRRVGDSFHVQVPFPENYPVTWLRKLTGDFVVTLQGARVVHLPDFDDEALMQSPELLAPLGRGETFEQVMEALAAELRDDREKRGWAIAQAVILADVVERAEAEIPEEWVEEEVRRHWQTTEGALLLEMQVPTAEHEQSLRGWLSDAETRALAKERLKTSLVVETICKRDGVQLTREVMEEMTVTLLERFLGRDDVLKLFQEEPGYAEQMMEVMWPLFAVNHVVQQAEIEYEPVAPEPD